jgi:hypothetical protein
VSLHTRHGNGSSGGRAAERQTKRVDFVDLYFDPYCRGMMVIVTVLTMEMAEG